MIYYTEITSTQSPLSRTINVPFYIEMTPFFCRSHMHIKWIHVREQIMSEKWMWKNAILDCASVCSVRSLQLQYTDLVRTREGGGVHGSRSRPVPRSTPHSIDRQILTHLHRRNKIPSQVEIPVYVST